MIGIAWALSAKGRSIGLKRASPLRGGVRPPCRNRDCATRTVMPEAMKFSATPEISWLPRKVIEASPWIPASTIDPAIPARTPTQTEPER